MRVKSVRYERLKKHPTRTYENERVGVEVEVGDGDDADAAMTVARNFVNRQLGDGLTMAAAQKQLDALVAAGVNHDTVRAVADDLARQVVDAPARSERYSLAAHIHQRGSGKSETVVPDAGTPEADDQIPHKPNNV